MRQKCSSTEQGGLLPIFSKTEKQQEQQEQEQQRCPPASHLPFQPITALAHQYQMKDMLSGFPPALGLLKENWKTMFHLGFSTALPAARPQQCRALEPG